MPRDGRDARLDAPGARPHHAGQTTSGATALEMHQVRYFLALARTLNFTRAAEDCNVTQPSLTRAIRLLEHELGGELVRRERGLTHLTELGERMLPLLTQCHESAVSARAVAAALRSRKVAGLRLVLSHGVDAAPFAPHLAELMRAMGGLALRMLRADPAGTAEALRDGTADLALCPPEAMGWERFESWHLFREPLSLVVPRGHAFADRASVEVAALATERLLVRRHCPTTAVAEAVLAGLGTAPAATVEVWGDLDHAALLAAQAGVGLLPTSTSLPAGCVRVAVEGLALARDICVWAAQGRQRGPAAAMLLTQLRAADWSRYEAGAPYAASKA